MKNKWEHVRFYVDFCQKTYELYRKLKLDGSYKYKSVLVVNTGMYNSNLKVDNNG